MDDLAQQGRSMLEDWLGRRSLKYSTTDGDVLVVGFADDDGDGRVSVLLRASGGDDASIAFMATGPTRYPRDSWSRALWACNVWNGKVRAPKARLEAGDWKAADDAALLLEASMPVVADTPQAAVDRFVEDAVRGALLFWTPAERDGAPAAP